VCDLDDEIVEQVVVVELAGQYAAADPDVLGNDRRHRRVRRPDVTAD
jgi:hypothetical protein